MRWLVFALVASLAVVRADFVAPAEGPVPFRRDKLPVDVDTLRPGTFVGARLKL